MTHQNLMTKESLVSTIETEDQTGRWFEFLLSQPAVKDIFSENISKSQLLRQLLKMQLLKNLNLFFLFSIFFLYLYLRNYGVLLFSGLFLFFSKYISNRVRSIASILSWDLIAKNFGEQEISRMTLYMLSDKFSKIYNIPSIVEVMTMRDENLRCAAISLIVGLALVYPYFNFLDAVILGIMIYLLIKNLMNVDFFYKNLK